MNRRPRLLDLIPCLLPLLCLPWLGLTGCSLDRGDRQAGRQALARWEDRRLAPQDSLVALLHHDDAHLRLAAARTAGLIGRSDVLGDLLELVDDPSSTVARQAAFSLGLLKDTAAIEKLEQAALHAPDPGLRVAALEGLGQLPYSGQALMTAALKPEPDEAMAGWNGLRNVAARADSSALDQTLSQGLLQPCNEVLWRVLRCVERAPWAHLTPAVAPHAHSSHTQVRVHAYRALARLGGKPALDALLDAGQDHQDFKSRQRVRVEVAFLRALGTLAPLELALPEEQADPRRDFLVGSMISGAGHEHPHVAMTALAAMAAAVQDLPLPPEAAQQESLLPVWRIRLARAAAGHREHPDVQVQAAAVRAWALLRGAGSGLALEGLMTPEVDAQVGAAVLFAASRVHPMPLRVLAPWCAVGIPTPALRVAALEGLVHVFENRPTTLPADMTTEYAIDTLTRAAADPDFVVACTAADLLSRFPSRLGLTALVELWDQAEGPARADLQLAVLGSLESMGTAVEGLRRPDPSGGSPDPLLGSVAGLLRESFDSIDLRVRDKGRDAALATGQLPDQLIPSAGSLLATMPAYKRIPGEAPLTLPFDAPRVRCVTDSGDIIIQLDGKLAPNTCAKFLDLIRQGFYDDLDFHRVVPDFVVQGGCPRGDGWGGPGFTNRSEWSRTPYERSVVGIAHSGKDSGGSQFFITLSEQPHLNGRYTVFGRVVEGMEVADRLTAGARFHLEILD